MLRKQVVAAPRPRECCHSLSGPAPERREQAHEWGDPGCDYLFADPIRV